MNKQLELLLVEDDEAAAELTALRLEESSAGAEAPRLTRADCLAAAQHALDRQRFDAVVLDLNLPDGSGLEGLRAVRRQAPETPVVVLTGNQDTRTALQAVQQGAQDYLTKAQMDEYPPLLGRSLRYAIERQRILMIAGQVEELKERERQLVQLNQMGELLQVTMHADEAYQIIVKAGAALFSQAQEIGGGLGIVRVPEWVEVVATWGDTGCGETGFSRQDCWALRRGRSHLHLEAEAGLACRHRHPAEAPGLCVPLIAQGEMLGIICLVACGERMAGAAKLQEMLPLAQTFAEHSALALSNLLLRERLQSQAIRDPLTGLLNRRFMEEALARELSRAQRSGESLGVLMIDLDLFKNYNDRHGHVAGDRLLIEVARFLDAHTRVGDLACRYGGDEFLLIMPEATLEVVHERAHQLRHGMRMLPSESPVTLSLGAAASPQHGRTAASLLAAADAAMYAAKREGRDVLRSPAA